MIKKIKKDSHPGANVKRKPPAMAMTKKIVKIFFIISRIGYAACNIFYDAMLIDITTDERMDRFSTCGYAFGYIGSCIPFVAGLLLILNGDTIGLRCV